MNHKTSLVMRYPVDALARIDTIRVAGTLRMRRALLAANNSPFCAVIRAGRLSIRHHALGAANHVEP
jgi:hypothetical protein